MTDDSPSMERIWAPWRINYVREEVDKDNECFLCRCWEEDDDRENLVLWRTELSFSLLNRWPYNNGHLLVAPHAHKADLLDMSDEQVLDQMQLIKKCKKVLSATVDPDGFNVGLNLGRSAGAGLEDHMHWHIVPRWHGDSNFMPSIAGTKVIPESLQELWELLHQTESSD